MKLLVDSGSTKADWIAIDENGKVLFTTQTLGLNPEVLDKEEIISRLDDKFDISQNKHKVSHLFFYGAGCGTDRMKDFLNDVFQEYFPNAAIVVHEDTYAAVYATTPKNEKAIVCILGTGSNCSYFDGKILHQKVQSLGFFSALNWGLLRMASSFCCHQRFWFWSVVYMYSTPMVPQYVSRSAFISSRRLMDSLPKKVLLVLKTVSWSASLKP